MNDGPPRTIEGEVRSWPGVSTGDTGRGGLRFSYGKVELGHLHGSSFADLPFPKKVRNALIEEGRASVHPPLPESGWVRRHMNGPEDVGAVIELFRMNYDRAVERKPRSDGGESAVGGRADHDQILGIVTSYEAAFNNNDARAMNALFDQEAIFVNVAGNLVFGAEPLHESQKFVFDGPLREVHVRYEVESLSFLSPDVAVVHARQRPANADGSLKGVDDVNKESIVVFVVIRGTAGWRIRIGQNTVVA